MEKEVKQRVRKEFKHGSVTQKMMSFKVDLDILGFLNNEKNKGRLINNLLREYYSRTNFSVEATARDRIGPLPVGEEASYT